MLIKHGATAMDGILKPLPRLVPVRSASAALLLGVCVLLSGSQLTAQDLLLKEYIYLDGRLLAVERQRVALSAQQPAGDADTVKGMEFAVYSPFNNRGIALLPSEGKTGISGIPGDPAMRAFHGQVSAGIFAAEKDSNRLKACDAFTPRLGSYGWHGKASGIVEPWNGGNDDGL